MSDKTEFIFDQKNSHFLFLDYESGGLNGRLENGELGCDYYPLFEVAVIITDSQLNEVGDPIRIVIHQTEEEIAKSHEWALEVHTKSGLLDEVRKSNVTLSMAEQIILDELQELGIGKYHRETGNGAILAGSSIFFDRSYMMCQMPELNGHLHYRQVDVSGLNILARIFKPEVSNQVVKELKHEALADIRETIAELKIYHEHFFK